MLRFVLFASLFILNAISFSVPGVPIKNYRSGERIQVFANELDSIKTQLNFKYYFLKFCDPANYYHISAPGGNLGSKPLGESTQITPYQVVMNQEAHCQKLCTVNFETEDVKNFIWMIENEYNANLVIDNLPAVFRSSETGSSHVGYPVGYKLQNLQEIKNDEEDYFIYNHLTFKIEYYPQGSMSRIFGFSIEPKSVGRVPGTKAHPQDAPDGTEGYCFQHTEVPRRPEPQKLTTGPVSFSYDVEFIEVRQTAFFSRWDMYKSFGNKTIHLYSALNFSIIIFILTTSICCIKRTIGRDIKQFNELGVSASENIQEEREWKQLSRDVFRPPNKPLLLSALIGTGVQLATMFFVILVFCCLGFVEHSYRGSLVTTILLFYTLMGIFAGYHSARIYKMFNGLSWIRCTLVTATLYPLTTFIIFCGINILLAFEQSSSALDAGTIFALVALWIGVSVPLVFVGSFCGYKKQAIQNPSKYNAISKPIKPQPIHLNPNVLCLFGGLLPFGSIFVEFVFVMISAWRHAFYYLFGYLSVSFFILVILCAEVSIIITYFQLCNGNHRVWWKSFFATGSIGLYMFCYSIFFFYTELEITRLSSFFMYFGSMLVVSITFSIFCGTVGFLSSYWFTRKIYASIRLD